MNKVFILLVCLISVPAMGQPNPDPATGIWYGKWTLALLPIAFGLIVHLLTLFIAASFMNECIQKGQAKHVSGVPFVGPLFINLGLWWCPSQIPVWVYLIPWGLEIMAGIVLVLVQKATHHMMTVRASKVPAFSALSESLRTAYFYDCYTVQLPPDARSPLEIYLSVVSRTPGWIDFLMQLRNKIVAQFGLKDVGSLGGVERNKPAQAYRIGDQAGIFKLLELHEKEVILGETDSHLDVKISVAKQDELGCTSVSVSTVVHVHNAMGRLYMFFVIPAHRIIAPATVTKLIPPSTPN